MLLPLRSAFWIIVVSFLLNGGSLPGSVKQHIPASARQSAAEVVSAMTNLRDVCDEHRGMCDIARASFDFAGHQLGAATESISKAFDKDR